MAWNDQTTNLWTIVQRANTFTRVAGISYLGQGQADWTAEDEIASIVTEAERDIYIENPNLNVLTTSLSVAINQDSVAAPGVVDYGNIRDIWYDVVGDPQRYEIIRQVSIEEYRNRLGIDRERSYNKVPTGWAISDDRNNILFMEKLSLAATFAVEYQLAPQEFVGADYVSSSTKYSTIPNTHIKTLVALVASRLAVRLQKYEMAERIGDEYARAMLALSEDLIKATAAKRRQIYEEGGFASPAMKSRTSKLGVSDQRYWRY